MFYIVVMLIITIIIIIIIIINVTIIKMNIIMVDNIIWLLFLSLRISGRNWSIFQILGKFFKIHVRRKDLALIAKRKLWWRVSYYEVGLFRRHLVLHRWLYAILWRMRQRVRWPYFPSRSGSLSSCRTFYISHNLMSIRYPIWSKTTFWRIGEVSRTFSIRWIGWRLFWTCVYSNSKLI